MAVKLGNGNWAVKEDKLLAYNDNSGLFFNKEFDFSRGTSATYVAKDGLIKTAGIQPNIVNNGDFSELGSELVTNGDFATDSDWTKGTGWSIADGRASYDGLNGTQQIFSNTGYSPVIGKTYKITFNVLSQGDGNNTASFGGVVFSNTNLAVDSYEFYVTAVGTGRFGIFGRDGGVFSIDNVSVKQVDPNDYWTLGSDWTVGDNKVIGDNSDTESTQQIFPDNTSRTLRIKYTLTVDSGQVAVYMSGLTKDWKTASGTYTDTITTTSKTIEFDGRNADPFSGTITDIIVQEIQTDTPRIDFTNDTKGHLLLEPSRTNSLPYSEDFTTYNDNHLSIESNTQETLSPQGIYNATKFTATNTDPYIFKSGINVTANTQTASIYVKGVGNSIGKEGRILFWYIGTAGGSNSSITFTLTSDWQRVEGSSTPTSSGTLAIRVDLPNVAEVGDESYVYGFQMEEGSYATSYIPTTGTTSTRNADVCNNSGSAQDFNSEEGVLYAEIAALADDGGFREMGLSNNTVNTRVLFSYTGTSNRVRGNVKIASSSTNFNLYYDATDVTDFIKVAVKFKSGDYALWVNGVERATNTTSDIFAVNELTHLNFTSGTGSSSAMLGKVRNLQVFTEALTDEQLKKLTS